MTGKYAWIVLCLLGAAPAAQADGRATPTNDPSLVVATVQGCIQADELLRRTCDRVGRNLSEKNRGYCDVPSVPFERRIAADFQTFQDDRRDAFVTHRPQIERALEVQRRSFERQFSELIQGRVSMFDLESLHREVTRRCVALERSLAPRLGAGPALPH